MNTYTLKISSILKETADVHTICFKQPALKKIKYLPGQYITLIVTINNRKYKRPYSLSSAPGIDQTLNITVKRLPHGIVSNHLIDIVKEGDLLEIMEPMGDFVYRNELHYNKEICLWSAGSGITPLMSILKVFFTASSKTVTLNYCNKSIKDTIFYKDLEHYAAIYKDRFTLNFFYTQQSVVNAVYGRIDDDKIVAVLNKIADINNTLHYICGPIGLKDTVKKQLLKFGLSELDFFSEDFEANISEDDLKEIQTRVVTIVNGDVKSKIEVIRGKSVLEAGLDLEIDLPYSCQTGSCTLCKAKLIAGEVKILGAPKPTADLLDDERLLCCSYPLTDNVMFEIE